jgi:2-octaprenyl-6-methoxyphenol hydroxylase
MNEPRAGAPHIGEPHAAVIGGGPAGLVAALALVHFGVPTVLVARRGVRGGHNGDAADGAAADNRTTALLGSSVGMLDSLGVWERCRGDAAPLRVLRLADDTRRLWRAPEVRFEAVEIGLEAFGWNIANTHLLAALWARADTMPGLAHVNADAEVIDIDDDGVTIRREDGAPLRCRIAVGADGRNSMCRAAADISVTGRAVPQTAFTFTLRHARPHHDASTEFHTEHGPFTLVPLPGLRSSLVYVVGTGEAQRIAALDGEALDRAIERRSHSILGKLSVEPGRGMFPLRLATADRLAARRVALVGEAAHLLPPIGAQGLNLGLRDGAALADIAGEIYRAGGDIGGDAAMTEYERRRRSDVMSRGLAVDLLNRSLLSDFLAVQGLRGLGLYALGRIGPLRRAVMREGVAPFSVTPRRCIERMPR